LSSQPYLFVYGTLKSSFRNRYARRLRREALLAGRATMPGRLYRIRWYPGMRPACRPEDVVTGELYRLRQPGKTLEALDEYEDDYRRELNRATLETGQSFPAWVSIGITVESTVISSRVSGRLKQSLDHSRGSESVTEPRQ
jgi:gamma-glutamylcyclotransferase (GGCT)/AIG2-like uncharacterized protein YtfP